MKPSLDNSYARVRRAEQHLARLRQEISAFGHSELRRSIYEDVLAPSGEQDKPEVKATETGAITYVGGNTTDPSTTSTSWADLAEVTGHITNPPPLISILIGECVYNLRAALDYLVYELAFLDSGQVQKGTQFPIEDRPEGWNRRHQRCLKRLSSEHQAILESLQPYRGCNWTGILRDLSNPDKHKSLLTTRSESVRMRARIRTTNDTPSSTSADAMEMNTKVMVQVSFDDGSEVVETLEELHMRITSVLDSFHPEFERK